MGKADADLALQLVSLLLKEHVNEKEVSEALSLLCSPFHFDDALVFTADEKNVFYNVIQSGGKKTHVRAFDANALAPSYRKALAHQTFAYIQEDENNNETEKYLLNLLNAKSIYLLCVVDENKRIDTIIFFIAKQVLHYQEQLQHLQTYASIILKYYNIEVYKKKLSFTHTALESILDNTGIDIYVNDFHTHDILYVNKSMAKPYGGKSAFMNNKCWEVLFPEQTGPCPFCPQQHLIDEEGNPTKVYTWDYQRAFDGSWFRVFSAAFRWVDGRLAHVVSSADITDNKKFEAMIQYMANYDALTDLPNRRKLVSDCEQPINQAKPGDQGYLLFFDIDGFKAINDNYGHDAGDEFLIFVAQYFKQIPLLKNNIYRNGGDEFVAIIDGPLSKDAIRDLAQTIHARFQQAWTLKAGEVFCNVSIGVACYPEDGVHAEPLLQIADKAMYLAKKTGGADIRFGYEL